MLTVRRRPPTKDELSRVEQREKFDPNILAGVVIFGLLGPGGVGLAIEWFLGLFSLDIAPYLRFGLPALAFPVAVWFVVSGWRAQKGRGPLLEVEEIVVVDPVFVKVEDDAYEFPVYVFQVEPDRLLYLCGQWLWDTWTFGGPDAEPDKFPSERFTIVRDPRSSSRVLRIEVEGTPLEPALVLPADAFPGLPWDIDLLDGDLDSLEAVMEARLAERW